ncbi:uncharacterized protein LY89DRAFT_676362 [Mollisia scopiformis]|uniref:Uncharacterized protein n=1 Tax=Mollisia scopiformis TaxID=149040 RepID=A0A132B9B2_MOLSC|nr:uncharacterized protein LY89DRAFT_676362 [Mollisia scopiformis]KUJ08986.1 hypothetical protein LY89DRAFT_676362 [Mollisia scopiformis]
MRGGSSSASSSRSMANAKNRDPPRVSLPQCPAGHEEAFCKGLKTIQDQELKTTCAFGLAVRDHHAVENMAAESPESTEPKIDNRMSPEPCEYIDPRLIDKRTAAKLHDEYLTPRLIDRLISGELHEHANPTKDNESWPPVELPRHYSQEEIDSLNDRFPIAPAVRAPMPPANNIEDIENQRWARLKVEGSSDLYEQLKLSKELRNELDASGILSYVQTHYKDDWKTVERLQIVQFPMNCVRFKIPNLRVEYTRLANGWLNLQKAHDAAHHRSIFIQAGCLKLHETEGGKVQPNLPRRGIFQVDGEATKQSTVSSASLHEDCNMIHGPAVVQAVASQDSEEDMDTDEDKEATSELERKGRKLGLRPMSKRDHAGIAALFESGDQNLS